MEKNPSSAEELKLIRKIMEESTRFLSLSGFSGVFLGLFAIAGAIVAWFVILDSGNVSCDESLSTALRMQLAADALCVLILSLVAAFYFSNRNAKKAGKSLWTSASRRLLVSLAIPLITGGVFALILLSRNQLQLIIPVFLIFYGLALINAGKFTYNEIFYLGIFEIITGLFSAVLPGLGLIFWVLGFGILHIVYGIMMYRKYEV